MQPAAILEITSPTGVFVAAVLVAVACQVASNYMRLPSIALWLAAGMLLGPYGFHLMHIEAIRPAMHTLIELGLAIILFEGGLNLNLRGLKEQGWVVGRLLILSPALTMLIGGGLAHLLTDLNWNTALLFGALVSVGGPTVIIPIIRQTRMERQLRHVLTGEAMLVDASGAILTIVMLQLVLVPGMHIGIILQHLLTKFAIGGAIGWLGGWLLSKILAGAWLRDTELRSTASLAFAWGIFMLADAISAQAGLLAVLVAGAKLQKMDIPDIERVRHFKASLSILLVSVLFVLLAADL
ncbi:MAG TPA: cation:proton antiporter, partial [Mariprofundaceae bacterium]|nr:cation:proton antiporter [Mariprofundaceae bacterium]